MSNHVFDTLFTFSDDSCYCNGNGDTAQCQVVGHCVCNAGWTGRADFSEGLFSCHIYNDAIIALWSLVIAVVVLAYYLSMSKLKQMVEKFLKVRARLKKKGKTHSLNSHRGLVVVLLLFGVVQPVLLGLAILRIVDSQQRVGLSIAFTILWTIVLGSFAFATHRYITAIATAMLRAEQSTNTYIARGRWFGRTLWISQALSAVLAYPVLFDAGNSKEISRICMILHLVWSVIVFSIMGIWIFWVRKQMLLVLNEHPEHVALKERMQSMLLASSVQSLAIAVALAIVCCVPILWTVHDYYDPILMMGVPVTAIRATNTVYVPSNGAQIGTTTMHDNTHVNKQALTAGNEDPQSELQ